MKVDQFYLYYTAELIFVGVYIPRPFKFSAKLFVFIHEHFVKEKNGVVRKYLRKEREVHKKRIYNIHRHMIDFDDSTSSEYTEKTAAENDMIRSVGVTDRYFVSPKLIIAIKPFLKSLKNQFIATLVFTSDIAVFAFIILLAAMAFIQVHPLLDSRPATWYT